MMKINLPNLLTVLRIAFVPVFMVFALYEVLPGSGYIALTLFVLAAATDWLDGYLARKHNQITNFGKIMDPLADKLLVTGALLCLVQNGMVSSWIIFIVLFREFLVSGIRISAAAEGNVIAASIWGKLKTVWQFAAIILALITARPSLLVDVMMWIAAILTIISGIDYVIKNRKHVSMN